MPIRNDLQKFISYTRRNGIAAAVTAARERVLLNREPYVYEPPAEDVLRAQRGFFSRRLMDRDGKRPLKFSILVPLYRTDRTHLQELIASVKAQSYGEWELLLADASGKNTLEKTVTDCANDSRIGYFLLPENGGISFNTNAAMAKATGDYIVLLDHDDLLTPDALYETERAIVHAGEDASGTYQCVLAYSDEDKFEDDKEGVRTYFEPHRKPDFDFDRLLSNNYICHLCAIRIDVARHLKLRPAYDGSQDYDLFLRAVSIALFAGAGEGQPVMFRDPEEAKRMIVHVPKVLYHWRRHAASTASNPQAKTYAYDAGRRAITDFLKAHALKATVVPLAHLGFYRVNYEPDVFAVRPDIGVVGGRVLDERGRITGGKMDAKGTVYYEGLARGQTGGYEHPAVLQQEAVAVDLRCMQVREELKELYETMTAEESVSAGVSADASVVAGMPDAVTADEEIRRRSIRFCKAVRERGYRILWDPELQALAADTVLAAPGEAIPQEEMPETEGEEADDGSHDHHSQL